MKKLLTKDYDNCFLSSLGLSEHDQEAHYHNFIIEHYPSNPNIIDGLKKAIDRAYVKWSDMAMKQIQHPIMIDDNGKPVYQKFNEVAIPAQVFAQRLGFTEGRLSGQFHKANFDGYKDLLNRFDTILKAWEAVKEYEALLPEDAKRKLKDLPTPPFLDIAGIEERAATVKLLAKIPERITIEDGIAFVSPDNTADPRKNVLHNVFTDMAAMAKGKGWTIGNVPDDVQKYAALKEQFRLMRQSFEDYYNNDETNKTKFIRVGLSFCDTNIQQLKVKQANPFLRSDLTKYEIQLWKDLKTYIKLLPEDTPTTITPTDEEQANNGIPKFNPDIIQHLISVFKVHFSENHTKQLEQLLNGQQTNTGPLVFLKDGNKLAYAFKELYEGSHISNCSKKQLQSWIESNFRYTYRGETKPYTPNYLELIISTNKSPCKNPLPILP